MATLASAICSSQLPTSHFSPSSTVVKTTGERNGCDALEPEQRAAQRGWHAVSPAERCSTCGATPQKAGAGGFRQQRHPAGGLQNRRLTCWRDIAFTDQAVNTTA